MALIGKIRDKSWLLLLIIGGAMLAFIVGVYADIRGQVEYEFGYGTVYGEKVDIEQFNIDVANAQRNADLRAAQQQQQSQPVDKSMVWSAFVEKIVLSREFDALGLDVSPAEFDAYLYGKEGFAVPSDIAEQFKDSITGLFNESLLQTAIEQMENSEDPEQVARWNESKEYYINRRKQEKYFEILGQGIYATKLEAKHEYNSLQETKKIAYVLKRFTEIADNEIDVTDEKLKAYYDEHKDEKQYENKKSSREVKIFDIVIQPSGADSAAFNADLESLKEGFATTENDSTYVLENSDIKFFTSTNRATFKPVGDPKAQQGMTYPAEMDTVFASANVGDVVGPYFENGSVRIAKVLDFNENTLTARHILIAAQRTDDAAVARAKATTDSIMAIINSDNFEELVVKHSEDKGSVQKGGKYEDFMDYEMVPEFSNFAKEEPIGKIGYVQTDYGFHIMEVLDRKSVHYPVLGIIQKTLVASEETTLNKEIEVDKLIYKLNDELAVVEPGVKRVERFDTIVNNSGNYQVRPLNIEENGPRVFGFESKVSEDKILKLAFSEGAMVGDLIDAPIKEGNRYVIAVLSAIKDKGAAKFEDIKDAIKRDYIKAEKVKRLTDQMVSAKSIAALEKKLGVTSQKADVTFGAAQITGAGYEPKIVGAIFSGLADGGRTMPLEGNMGVYVVQIEKTTPAKATSNYLPQRDKLLQDNRRSLQGQATRALTEQADVIDNRRFFETNIRR